MVNLAFIEQNIPKRIIGETVEAKLETIKKLTHLQMHSNYIQHIGDLSPCKNLQVLYLHNNGITEIKNLHPLKTLIHLYLQRNKISKIEGLENLEKLKKLYLGTNKISVVEKLENLHNLEELHIEKQDLCKGECLCFEPRTIINFSNSLQILNISHNNITTIEDLFPLKYLKILKASFNKIKDYQSTANVMKNWYQLTDADFTGNPMTKLHRYRETIIANTFRLVVLDKKDINETTRNFIKRFEHEKSLNKPSSTTLMVPSFAGDVPPPIKKAISKSLLRNLETNLSGTLLTTSMSEETTAYVPWNALKITNSNLVLKCPPPMAKKQQPKKSAIKKVHFSTVIPDFPSYKD